MKKRLLSIGLALLLTILLLPAAAAADNTIIVNLGSAEAGASLDMLVGTTAEGTAELSAGALPDGCTIVTEARGDAVQHYLRGLPMTAGLYEFTLTVTTGEPEETLATLTCSLSITPATPVLAAMNDLALSLGDSGELTVSATAADNGALSYQWYSNSFSSNQNGTLLAGATAPVLPLNGAVTGTTYYYCVVTNTNNGRSVSANSQAVAVTVAEPELVGISVNVMPVKRQYTVGESLDLTGLQLLLRYSNGSTANLDSGYEAEPLILDRPGTQQIVVRYAGLSCTFPVLVEEAAEEVLSVTLLRLPDRLEYLVGDWLDTTGISLRVETNKGTYDVTSGFACNPRVLDREGVQTITVNYGAQSTTFTVTVKPAEKIIESISVLRRPTKLSYTVGDAFDPSGMILSVVTNQGTEEVGTGFSYMPTRFLSSGTQTVTITYEGKSCTLDIVVSPKPEESAEPDETPTPVETPKTTENPVVTPKPDVRPARKSSGLVLGIVIAAAIALAALLAYVYVARQDKLAALWQKLKERFKKN